MEIEDYVKEYTLGYKICFKDVLGEIREFLVELLKFNKNGILEEFADVFHFFQLWLYWRFGVKGETWRITQRSVDKYIGRRKIWQDIYLFVGLDKNISGYCGNYLKGEKVVRQLSKFGIGKEKAEAAYRVIVLKKQD